jgi:hypothetical protein
MFEESAFEKIMEEEKRRQALFQDLINPPWKRMAEDKLREQGALWFSRLDALDALGKSVAERINMINSAFQGGIERLRELSAPAQASISNIITAAQELDRRASEAFDALRDATERNALLADSVKDKIRYIDEKLRTPLQFQLSVSPMENAVTSFAKLFEVGRSIADDAERLYGKLSANEIGLYGNLWEKNVSPAFANDAVGFMTDFIGEVEDDEPEDGLAVVRETVAYLKEHAKEFLLVSPKQGTLIGVVICQFLYVIDYISKGMKAGTMAPESGSIQIVWLYFTLIYAICELKKKE